VKSIGGPIVGSQGGYAVVARNDSTQQPAPDAARTKSGTPVAEEVVLEDYVMLDFVEDFVGPGELHASVPDSD
jgi:hypothetical protein